MPYNDLYGAGFTGTLQGDHGLFSASRPTIRAWSRGKNPSGRKARRDRVDRHRALRARKPRPDALPPAARLRVPGRQTRNPRQDRPRQGGLLPDRLRRARPPPTRLRQRRLRQARPPPGMAPRTSVPPTRPRQASPPPKPRPRRLRRGKGRPISRRPGSPRGAASRARGGLRPGNGVAPGPGRSTPAGHTRRQPAATAGPVLRPAEGWPRPTATWPPDGPDRGGDRGRVPHRRGRRLRDRPRHRRARRRPAPVPRPAPRLRPQLPRRPPRHAELRRWQQHLTRGSLGAAAPDPRLPLGRGSTTCLAAPPSTGQHYPTRGSHSAGDSST